MFLGKDYLNLLLLEEILPPKELISEDDDVIEEAVMKRGRRRGKGRARYVPQNVRLKRHLRYKRRLMKSRGRVRQYHRIYRRRFGAEIKRRRKTGYYTKGKKPTQRRVMQGKKWR